MKIKDFEIGGLFFFGYGGQWKCTDIGTRTITAVKINLDEGKDSDWFSGPPYAVKEVVFNEKDISNCYKDNLSRLEIYLNKHFSDKPKFSDEAKDKISKMYEDFKLTFFDNEIFHHLRVGPNGEIYQPITPNINQEMANKLSVKEKLYVKYNYQINIYELFTNQFYSMPVKKFLKFKIATEQDYKNRKSSLNVMRNS